MAGDQRDLLPARTELQSEYEFVRELGRGGTGVVYLARERASGRDVAIKLVRARYLEDDETLRRFAREASTVTRLRHPAIVATESVRQLETGDLALIMRYVPGPTLRELLRRHGAMSVETTERVLLGVAEALAYAHSQGIVHRDVKPENIFYSDESGRPVLSDFGIARPIEAESLTLTGVAIGTPSYMSPEQIDGSGIDGRSDLYGLGLVGWEMLSGRRPWDGESLYSVIYKQKQEHLPPLERLRPDVPPHLLNAIQGALEKNREDRWANADEFAAQLRDRSGTVRFRRPSRMPVVARPVDAPLPAARGGATMELPPGGYIGVADRLGIEDEDDDAPFPALVPDRRFSRGQAALGAALLVLLVALAIVTTRPDTGIGRILASEDAAGEIAAPDLPPAPQPGATPDTALASSGTPAGDTSVAPDTLAAADSAAATDSVAALAPRDSAIVPALSQSDRATPAIEIAEQERQQRAARARIEREPAAPPAAPQVAPPL
ncbi:MAG TPA: serine/threonine-protein kinase, partial [Gemmatimonadaceae bacterium]|nr:serine/threonine-protein kinase [Gemmatimonadaceae bacterium]